MRGIAPTQYRTYILVQSNQQLREQREEGHQAVGRARRGVRCGRLASPSPSCWWRAGSGARPPGPSTRATRCWSSGRCQGSGTRVKRPRLGSRLRRLHLPPVVHGCPGQLRGQRHRLRHLAGRGDLDQVRRQPGAGARRGWRLGPSGGSSRGRSFGTVPPTTWWYIGGHSGALERGHPDRLRHLAGRGDLDQAPGQPGAHGRGAGSWDQGGAVITACSPRAGPSPRGTSGGPGRRGTMTVSATRARPTA